MTVYWPNHELREYFTQYPTNLRLVRTSAFGPLLFVVYTEHSKRYPQCMPSIPYGQNALSHQLLARRPYAHRAPLCACSSSNPSYGVTLRCPRKPGRGRQRRQGTGLKHPLCSELYSDEWTSHRKPECITPKRLSCLNTFTMIGRVWRNVLSRQRPPAFFPRKSRSMWNYTVCFVKRYREQEDWCMLQKSGWWRDAPFPSSKSARMDVYTCD